MDKFITGRLDENEIGASYQGGIYDRWLVVHALDNQTLSIFDHSIVSEDIRSLPNDATISGMLHVGETYSFLIAPLTFEFAEIVPNAETFSPINTSDPKKVWQGKIVDLHWREVIAFLILNCMSKNGY